MAENDYTSSLNILLGGVTKPDPIPQSPESEIKGLYEEKMAETPQGLGGLIENSIQSSTIDDVRLDRIAGGMAAERTQDELFSEMDRFSQSDQAITDPHAMIGSTGQRTARALKAGWGDLVSGTGDTVDFISALVTPGEGELTTAVGSWLKKVGTEYQNENALILSEDLQDVTWDDMFKGEFWSSKVARLVPYAASFLIPYAGGARLAGLALGRLGPTVLKYMQGTKVLGQMNKGVKLTGAGSKAFKGKKGTGLMRYLGVDAGKKGIAPTKLLRDVTGYIGGGATANIFEGAYLAGEAYQELANEVDPITGEPMFSPEEAAEQAAGVMRDNAKWMGVDILQYGILFGGAGRGIMGRVLRNPVQKTAIGENAKGLISSVIRRYKPNLTAVGAYAGIEGVTEAYQEVYQEWAKYKNIQEAKGLDYEPMSVWLKEAPFGEDRPELRDIFWSSVGLGGAMGGVRGYFDGIAERQALIDKKIDSYNNVIDLLSESMEDASIDQQLALERAIDNLLASNIWNYSGDGSAAMSIVDNLVKDNKITEEQGNEYKVKIEQAEQDYAKHHVNTSLTEAGAEQAFYNEMKKTRKEGEMAEEKASYEDAVAHEKTVIKDKKKLEAKLKMMEDAHNEVMEQHQKELAEIEQSIEDIYTAEVDKAPTAKSTGKRDARYKKEGLSKDEFETFTQEGEKQKTEREKAEAEAKAAEEAAKPKKTLRETLTEVGTKALQTAKDVGAAAVKGVQGVVDRVTKPASEIEAKAAKAEVDKAIEKVKENENMTSGAKKRLIKALEDGDISPESVEKIKGSGRGGKINNKDAESAIRKEKKAEQKTTKESQEDVKKKDKSQVVPKTKQYKDTEEALKGKGVKPFAASISKMMGKKAGALSYIIKTAAGKSIKFFADRKVDIQKYTREMQNVTLRLVEPVAGQANVVEVDGKLYFQFKKGAPLYESKIEVVVDGEVIGEMEQATQEFYEDKGPIKKAKKKDQRKIDKLIGAIKETKENIKKYFTRGQSEIPNYEPTVLDIRPLYKYGSGVMAASIVRDIVNKKFPGAKGVLSYTKLIDDYGQEASSLAIGSTVFINIDSVAQTDIIHEAGHIYYGLMEDTPLMKRIKKLLPKSELYQKTKQDYPELILMSFKGMRSTLGAMYRNILNSSDGERYTSDIIDITNNIAAAEKAGDSARINELFLSLRTQLKVNGAKDVRIDQQKHLLEETFTRALESYSYGRADAVIKDSATQKRLEKDLIEFYKEAKKLATDEEAKQILDLTVEGVASLDLENAMKAVLLNFNSADRTVPYMMNSAYGDINRAKKKPFQKATSYAAVSSYIGDFIGRNLMPEQIADRVMQAIADDSNLDIKDELIKDTKEYIKAIITQLKRPQTLKQADTILDKELAKIGISLKSGDDVIGESESTTNEVDKYDDLTKAIALPTTTTNFIKKIVEVHNHREDDQIKTKDLLATLMSLAKDTRENPMDFPNLLRTSINPNIMAMLNVLDRVYKNDKVLTNAKLMEIKGPIEGINIEVLAHNVLTIGDDGKRYWTRYASTNATIEQGVVANIAEEIKGNKTKVDEIAAIYNELFFERNPKSKNDRYNAAYKVLDVLLNDNPRGSLIDKNILLNTEILFKGKRQSLTDILFSHTKTKFGPIMRYQNFLKYKNKKVGFSDDVNGKVLGLFHGTQGELKTILLQGLVASRGVNYLSMVDNVEQDGVSIMNKENGLHNRLKNVERIFNEEIELDKNDIMHRDNNIYSQMAFRNKNTEGKRTFHLTVHSGMMRRIIDNAVGLKNKEGRAKVLNDVNPNELIAGDFFMFLNKYNQGIKNKQEVILYDQPIAVFSDKSRRYYIESIAAIDTKSRKALLSRVKNNPAYNAKYKNGDRIFPYTIEKNKIKEMPKLKKQWREYAINNKELFINNTALNKGILQDGAVEAFLTSYIANKFMAQQLFVHDHRQSNNQVDYIKRAAGSIASHVVFDRNSSVEFIVTKDFYEDKEGNIYTEEEAKKEFGDNWKDNVAIENDAMGYILPEQAEFIRAKYGESQKVGNVFKFVYHYTQLEGPLKGRTTYMKFAVHTLTPELEAKSPYLKNIGEVLRTRKGEVDALAPGNLVIASSESAAKLYSGGSEFIYDITTTDNMADIMAKQDEIYSDETGYIGLSGEGLGIQLELDKQTDERFFPSQLFYNLLTNINEENRETINRMLELRRNVMESNNSSRNRDLIMNDKATEKGVFNERDSFKSSVTAEVFDVLVDNTYDNLDPRYPYLNAVHNAVATGRITHKGTKMYTKGSIGYQSSSLGMGLRSYEKGLYKGDENVVASEAIVPGYLRKQGVKKGDLFIGTRVPAHGKVSSSIFVVKDFHKQIGDSPTSNVTIPAWVSKNWGADLDGDSVHMNFKWTETEVAEKGWRKDSNEFFDLYVELASKDEIQKEIQADIDFVSDSENAIAKVPALKDTDSQLTPWGDAQMFEDNVPAKHLVGMIAALQRSFNVFSNSRDVLPFAITIKGESEAVTRETFFDDATLENGVGNWYGVAQLLNIALDNAKHQYASKLGLDMQSVFPFVLLRRLGYSLNDLAVLFNSPIVKKYMESKRNSSKDYISKHSDIMDMFIQKDGMNENQLLKFAKDNGLGNINIKDFVKNPAINIDLKGLKNSKAIQKQAILMLYTLDKFKKAAVDPLSKAFTVHQSIEKNPLELRQIREGIAQAQGLVRIPLLGKMGLDYSFTEKTKTNNIIEHATGLFDSILQRASRTDIRYTPYMQTILTNPIVLNELNKLGEMKSEVINQVISNNLRQEFSMLSDVKGETELIKEFEALQERRKGNYFLDNVIQVSDKGNYIVLNRAEITEFTSYKAIEQIKESFAELSEAEKNLIFEIEHTFNRFGLAGGAGKATSFVPFFDNEYTKRINEEMSRIIEDNQNKQGDYSTGAIPVELQDAIKDVERRRAGKNKYTLLQKISKRSKDNNSFEIPIKKAKKIITADTSYNNDYLGSGVEFMTFPEWVADKGIDINKIEEESKTFRILTEKYNDYRGDLRLVREFEATLEKKPLSKYTIEGLYDVGRKFRKMDNSATKGIAYQIEKEIGQKAFRDQAEYLKNVGASKGYKYNIPGEDGVAQEDLTNFQAWLGSNNMTSKRPEIQYLINEAQIQYRKYMRSFKEHRQLIEEKNRALVRSKMRGLSVLERIRKEFDTNARYQYIYGNIATVENGNVRLFTEEEIIENGVELTKQEEEYYIRYKAIAEILLGSEDGKTIVPGMQMGNVESMSRSGLFGLYNTSIDSHDYSRVKVYGTDKNGNRALKTFYEWKYDVYKGRTGKLTLDSGKQIFELEKLRRKAKQLKDKGKHEDGSKIMLSDAEYDALVNNGAILKRMIGYDKVSDIDAELIQEYERRKGVKAQNISYDINNTLIEFARGHIFANGEGLYKMEDGVVVEREDRFTGMGDLAILTDSIIGFNKNLDNKNAVRYLTGWWKEGFLEKKEQVGIFGKTGDKVIDGFVRLTSLRLLGFNMTIGLGNTLAGKYQELRKRGGKQFMKGEERYWKELFASRNILKKYRIVEYSFDEFIHLSEKEGPFGKIERWSYMFMDKTEGYIQGAAFLGMLTDQEFTSGKISEERVMHINHKISTLHGEGYTALDASLLSMYSYGRALLQFKKWFITLFQDRFRAEDIDRFGDVNIGSYRASSEYITDLFRKYFAGGITKKEIIDIYNNSSDQRKREMRNHAAGIGIGVTLLSLIAMMEDDDEPDTQTLRTLKKLSHDVFVTTDLRRFVNYTAVPSSYSTMKNANRMIYEAVRGDKVRRTGPYGEAGSSQAIKTMRYEVSPFAEAKKDIANIFYSGPKGKKETSSLIR